MMNNRYVIVSPVRNEEEYIEKTIISVVSQTILPVEWIIVNDGSTDKTPEIISHYLALYPWIKLINREKGQHSPGVGVIKAFYAGFEQRTSKEFDFIVKLDGDLSFDPMYFENILKEFDKDPKLGIASGKTYIPEKGKYQLEPCPDDHTRGPAKMYSAKCFEDIGGMPVVLGWDTLDELKAQLLGYTTKSFWKYVIIHYKPVGYKQKNNFRKFFIAGERHNYLGYHWLFATLKSLSWLKEKPYIFKGLISLFGFYYSFLSGGEQIEDKQIVKYLRKKQLRRIFLRK